MVKPVLVTTCIQKPPLFRDHSVAVPKVPIPYISETTSVQRPVLRVAFPMTLGCFVCLVFPGNTSSCGSCSLPSV
jgi:hypothetical protein